MTTPGSPEQGSDATRTALRPPRVSRPYCVFCNIIAGREPANVIYEDDDVIVVQNLLRWVPVQLLALPRNHMLQAELWGDIGHLAKVASQIGAYLCPAGFRLVSNFSYDGMQSQEHAHVHILGGTFLGHYVDAGGGPRANITRFTPGGGGAIPLSD